MPGTFNEQLARELFKRLDNITSYLATISAQLTILGADPQHPESGPVFGADSAHNAMMEILLSYALPSSPAYTLEYTINAVTPTLIAANDSGKLLRVVIINDDPAQMIWLGPDPDTSPVFGRVLLAQNSVNYVLPQGASLYAICAVATVSCRVESGYNLRSTLLGRVG